MAVMASDHDCFTPRRGSRTPNTADTSKGAEGGGSGNGAASRERTWRFTPHTAHNSLVLDLSLAEELEDALHSSDEVGSRSHFGPGVPALSHQLSTCGFSRPGFCPASQPAAYESALPSARSRGSGLRRSSGCEQGCVDRWRGTRRDGIVLRRPRSMVLACASGSACGPAATSQPHALRGPSI